jgi:hypothetical protein
MLGNQVGGESGNGNEMTSSDCAKKCGGSRTAKSGMQIRCKFLFGAVSPENTIGLMVTGGLER